MNPCKACEMMGNERSDIALIAAERSGRPRRGRDWRLPGVSSASGPPLYPCTILEVPGDTAYPLGLAGGLRLPAAHCSDVITDQSAILLAFPALRSHCLGSRLRREMGFTPRNSWSSVDAILRDEREEYE